MVGEQIVSMLRQKKVECFPLDKLQVTFTHHYGYQIPLKDFSVFTVEELMAKLKHVLKVKFKLIYFTSIAKQALSLY